MAGMRGRSGRKPKPDALKELEGSRRPRGATSNFKPGVPRMPSGLAPIARACWKKTVAEMAAVPNLLCELDTHALVIYCNAWQTYHDAAKQLKADGGLLYTPRGPHPLISVQRGAVETILKVGALFGMSPAARSTLRLDPPKPGVDDENSVAKLLQIRGA